MTSPESIPVIRDDPAGTCLRFPASEHTRLVELVTAGYPHETCGVLLGRRSEGDAEIERLTEAKNLNTDRAHDRYVLDPADLLAAEEIARSSGLEVVGIWHSHPDHPARPSITDRDAAWEGWSYVIAEVTCDGVPEITSWRLIDGAFQEEAFHAEEQRP